MLLSNIRRFLYQKRLLKQFQENDAKYTTLIDEKLKAKYAKKGFFAVNILNYELEKNDYKDYVSDWDRLFKIKTLNERNNAVIADKIIFHHFFQNQPKVLRPLAYTWDQRLIGFETKEIITPEKFVENLTEDIICKLSRGSRGTSILKIKVTDKKKSEVLSSFKTFLQRKRPYVIQTVIKQDGFYHEINPPSVNTFRILVMHDVDTGEPFIAQAVQRVGSKASGFLDNWSTGGISIAIDLETGVLKKGATRPSKGTIEWHSIHPETKVHFEGYKIKNWFEIKSTILELSKEIYFINYIGWDVIPTENSYYVLEANHNSDLDLLQIHGGFLKNPRIKAFYKKHNLISNL